MSATERPSHGSSTVIVEDDPNWLGFDPVPQLCIRIPVKDHVWPKRDSDLRHRSIGAKAHETNRRQPCLLHVRGEQFVRRFPSINAAFVYLGKAESGKLRVKLSSGKVHVYETGTRQWTTATPCPADLAGLKVVAQEKAPSEDS